MLGLALLFRIDITVVSIVVLINVFDLLTTLLIYFASCLIFSGLIGPESLAFFLLIYCDVR